ncbi:MAG: hypothetical protein ACK5O7_06440 [Holosporales bacterium]
MNSFYKMALCVVLVLTGAWACPTESDTPVSSSPATPSSRTASTTPDHIQDPDPRSIQSIGSHSAANLFAYALHDAEIPSPYAASAEQALSYVMHNIHHKPEPFITWLQDQLPKRIFTTDEWEVLEQFQEIKTEAKIFRQYPDLFLSAPVQQRASFHQRISARLMNIMRTQILHLNTQAHPMSSASIMDHTEQKKAFIQSIDLTSRLHTLTTLIFWDVFKAISTAETKLTPYATITRAAYDHYTYDPEFQHRVVATALLAITPSEFWASETIQCLCVDYLKTHTQPSLARGKIASLMHMKFFSACPQAIHPSWTQFSARLLGTDYSATASLTLSCCKAVIDVNFLQDMEPIRVFLRSVDPSKLPDNSAELFGALWSRLDVLHETVPSRLSTPTSPSDWVASVLLP